VNHSRHEVSPPDTPGAGRSNSRAAVPIAVRGIDIAVVARVTNGICNFLADFKRARSIYRFGVDFQPRADVFADLDHLWIEIAATMLGEIEQHGSVPADVLHQQPDYFLGIHRCT